MYSIQIDISVARNDLLDSYNDENTYQGISRILNVCVY